MTIPLYTCMWLQELLRVYQNSAGDKWRAMSTTKAIQAIKKHPKEITSYEVWICTVYNRIRAIMIGSLQLQLALLWHYWMMQWRTE